MGSFDSIVAILTVTMLLTKVGKCTSNEDLYQVPSTNESVPDNGNHSLSESSCVESISRNVPQYIPYTETYRARSWGLYRPQIRTNYKLEYHVLWSVEQKCCKGYVQIGRMCMPHCSHPCERGTCVRPDVCRCNAGYRMSRDVTNDRELCTPVCTNGCVNGTCVDVEVCSCNDGYWMDSDGFTCRPVCDIECERNHGYCAEPNVCLCRSGYVKVETNEFSTDSSRCEPVCDRACTNGHCTAPNICSCKDGYESDESDPRFTCSPKCDEGCAFGKCTAPGICTCYDGYRKVNASVCEPICSEPCMMGTCAAPETCNCEAGYGLLGVSRYICKPICEANCGNGTCIAPDVCTCNEGYRAANASTCEPICSEPCVMGACVAPESCNCNVGYARLGESRYICDPICEAGCGNGRCTAPKVCTCNDGYATDADGRCAPVCAEECVNGTCTAPNRCTCGDGFALRNTSFCEPICEGDCRNGECIGPNQCVCHDNFVSTIRRNLSTECVPACTRNCSGHGVCMIDDENDNCQCYFGWTGWDCDRPTMCVIMMDFIRSDVSKLTIYNETNSTIMRAHENAPYCYQCSDNFLDTESLCYVVQSDEANTTSSVGCLLSTDLPCYMASPYNSSTNIDKVVWLVVAIIVSILTSLIAATYLIYRRHQRKKLITASTSSTLFAQEAFATESLLSENVIYL